MDVIALCAQKGGSGKTTLAAHLGVAAEAAGAGPVVYLDLDAQGSLAAWWNARQAETPQFAAAGIPDLSRTLPKLRQAGFKVAILDTPPSLTTLPAILAVATLVVLPVKPSPHDLRAIGATLDQVEAAGSNFCFAINQAKPRTQLVDQAIQTLAQFGKVAPAVIHDRVDYAAAMIDGRTIQETDAHGKGADEIGALWSYVAAQLRKKGGKR
jgi:chromosome partitioning protein